MTIISLSQCCRLLAIDPKTLRRWLSLAHLPVQPHPLDTRLKCVTHEQLQQVAAAHHRRLPESSEQPFQAETSARGMTRIRDFEGHLRPFFFFRRSHLFRSFHHQKFKQLFLQRANIVLLLERFSESEPVSSLIVWSICRCFRP